MVPIFVGFFVSLVIKVTILVCDPQAAVKLSILLRKEMYRKFLSGSHNKN